MSTDDLIKTKAFLKTQITNRILASVAAPNAIQNAKLEEARDVVDQLDDAGDPISSMKAVDIVANYPLLAASIGIDGNTLAEVAIKVQEKAMASRAKATALEHFRQTSCKIIDDCTTKQACEAAYIALKFPEG